MSDDMPSLLSPRGHAACVPYRPHSEGVAICVMIYKVGKMRVVVHLVAKDVEVQETAETDSVHAWCGLSWVRPLI